MSNLFKKLLMVEFLLGIVVSPSVIAALDLPETPLIAGSTVEPNMMLLLDSSGSMNNIVADSVAYDEGYSGPYDQGYSADYSYTCDEANEYPSNNVYPKVDDSGNGTAYFSSDRDNTNIDTSAAYTFGNDATSNSIRCFDNEETYTGAIFANTISGTIKYADTYGTGSYTGHFLNWYFDPATGHFTDGQKDNSSTRMEEAIAAASDLVNGLADIRIGLAQYNGQDGAEVLVNIDDVENQTSALTTAIAGINADGYTPLAESLQDLGWYFSADGTGNLILNGESGQEACAKETVFTPHGSSTTTPPESTTVVQYWCQQNFIVAMTDGLPTQDGSISEKLQDYSNAANGVDVVKAMYETDLRPDLDNDAGDADPNNVTTYMIGFADSSLNNSDLMNDMAEAGGGGELITAGSASGLSDAFSEATQSIFSKIAAMSSVSFNSSEVTADSALFQADFNTSGWTGELKAFAISDLTTEVWNAGTLLDAYGNTVDGSADDVYDRNIFTYNSDSDTKKGVEFNFANLSDAQKNDLYQGVDADGDGSTSNDEEDANLLINFLKGDTSNEGTETTNYRERTSRLGDIVNSTTVYVGAPQLSWPDYSTNAKFGASTSGESYSDFKSGTAASRTPMVYVGANDGMLHGFNASLTGTDAGKEKMAYIPEAIASTAEQAGMHYLADRNYAYQYYVDLTPTVSDVYITTDSNPKAWHSVLVGGLRAGGQGLFALDVTNPNNFTSSATNAENLVLWEFTNSDDADFGYSYSKPTVAMMANGKWAVIVGNGYNSNNGKAALFVLFIEEGTDGTWTVNTDYIKIAIDSPTNNGLSTPTVVDTDGDSVADRIYAGDLQGNMWAFDVTDTTATNWKVAHDLSSTPKPLFTALNSDSEVQPITSAPMVSTSPDSSGASPNLLVFFGTGKYLEETDISENDDVMSYYSVLDTGVGQKVRSNLTPRNLLTTSDGLRTITGSAWDGTSGWYMDLVDRELVTDTATELGERVVSDSTISGEILFFNSIIPSGSACSSGGESWFMSIDLETGLAPSYAIFDADGDGVIENTSAADGGDIGYIGEKHEEALVSSSAILGDTQYSVDSTGEVIEREVNDGELAASGRLSWEEMVNN